MTPSFYTTTFSGTIVSEKTKALTSLHVSYLNWQSRMLLNGLCAPRTKIRNMIQVVKQTPDKQKDE